MSDEIDDGGTAFPAANDRSTTAGMSLRDWFAGQALASVMREYSDVAYEAEDVAEGAYQIADAMIKERNK